MVSMSDTQLNSTAAALLGLLADGPQTGGDLVAAAESRLGAFWSMTRSQVYRELPKLADDGLVRLGKVGPRGAQPYAITAAGKRVFTKWLAQPAGPDRPRSPMLLRVAFGSAQTAAVRNKLIARGREEHEASLAVLREQVKQSGLDRYERATLELAVTNERALLKWLDTVAKG